MVSREPKRLIARIVWAVVVVVAVGLLLVLVPAIHIGLSSRGKEYSAAAVPEHDVAIVLGARVYDDGTPSPFLKARLDLAVDLFEAGKVRTVLASGGNTVAANRETDVMVAYLVDAGVPADKIVGDPKGYDTFASCARAHDVYGVRSAIVVSQGYHIPRAVTLCGSVGIDVVGVGDYTRRSTSSSWLAGSIREWFAGPKVELDLLLGGADDPYDPVMDRALGR